jgi:hypothetical protein
MSKPTNTKATETLITHFWGTLTEARQVFPRGVTKETVSGGLVTASRYEVTTYRGHPAIAVYGVQVTAEEREIADARDRLAGQQ